MFFSQDMIDFFQLLKKHKVQYVVVGGFAVIYYGYVRTTQDIDILSLPTAENAKKMLDVLREFGFGEVGFTQENFQKEGTAIHLGAEPNRIDILTSLQNVSNSAVFSRVKRIRHKGLSLNIISLEDLLACKRQSSRLKDRADVEMLENTAKKLSPTKKRIAPKK
jgi:predicted nucleotidyltransferase